MRKVTLRATILALALQPWLFIFGQTAAGPPAFEVASVKPAAAQTPGRMMMGCRGGPGSPDPGLLSCSNVNVGMLMSRAYGVQGYQINGPAWFDSEHFDITAKIPAGATKDQFNQMLQNMLAERFQVKLHRETKELPMHRLAVGKGGPKMKPSGNVPPSEDAPKDLGPMGEPPPPPRPGPGGFPEPPKGRPGLMMMFMNGKMRLVGTQQTVSDLAQMLGGQLGRPVVDETGLKGKYDFTLDFTPEPGRGMPGGMPMPMPPPGGGSGGGMGGPGADSQEGGPTLITAIQEQLGLKLESKKGPVEILVVDHAEKVPTEN
jgi:uncharacterized protein (TIGR03435 family)